MLKTQTLAVFRYPLPGIRNPERLEKQSLLRLFKTVQCLLKETLSIL